MVGPIVHPRGLNTSVQIYGNGDEIYVILIHKYLKIVVVLCEINVNKYYI